MRELVSRLMRYYQENALLWNVISDVFGKAFAVFLMCLWLYYFGYKQVVAHALNFLLSPNPLTDWGVLDLVSVLFSALIIYYTYYVIIGVFQFLKFLSDLTRGNIDLEVYRPKYIYQPYTDTIELKNEQIVIGSYEPIQLNDISKVTFHANDEDYQEVIVTFKDKGGMVYSIQQSPAYLSAITKEINAYLVNVRK